MLELKVLTQLYVITAYTELRSEMHGQNHLPINSLEMYFSASFWNVYCKRTPWEMVGTRSSCGAEGEWKIWAVLEPGDKLNDSTIGCKILALRPGKFLTFEWKGPKQFKRFMNNADPLTQVVVFFLPSDRESEQCTEVYLIHSGWRISEEWERARQWFDKVWAVALSELEKHVKHG